MPYRNYPDKALDVMDQVGASIKSNLFEMPHELAAEQRSIFSIDGDIPEERVDEFTAKLAGWNSSQLDKISIVSKSDIERFFQARKNAVFKLAEPQNKRKLLRNNPGFEGVLKQIINGVWKFSLKNTHDYHVVPYV
jgi:ATP-dependent Clp protease ATP-binding subunit ClpA